MKKFTFIIVFIVVCGAIGLAYLRNQKKDFVTSTPMQSYVALGDSVSAGVGLKTDSDSSACDRTDESYPKVLASSLNYSVTNLSCSGATLDAGILGSQTVNKLAVSPQIDKLFNAKTPTLITIMIGANDLDWTSVIARCYVTTCGSPAETSNIDASLQIFTQSLESTLQRIKNRYGANTPQVIVTGYHKVFGASGISCSDVDGVTPDEQTWVRELQSKLDTAIKATVDASGFALYAPIDFSGHELCTADSWVQGVNAQNPYHPTEAGQRAYATQIEKVIKEAR